MAERRKTTRPGKTAVRKTSRATTAKKSSPKRWSQRVTRESDALDLKRGVFKLTSAKKIPAAKMRDLRDMLTLLRKFSIKPEKGRRKDLKKIDALVGDLTMLIEQW